MRSQPQAPVVVPMPDPARRAARAVSTFASLAILLAGLLCAWTPSPASAQARSDGRASTASGTITNDDRAAASVTLSVNPSSVSEDAGSTSVTVTATADAAVAANTAVTVSIGGGTATAGTDYTAVAELAIEIPAGGTTGTGAFKLTPIDDTEVEGKETISVSGRASGLSVNGTSLTLTDKEEVTAEWWFGARLSVSPGSVSENGGKQLVMVTAEVSEWGRSSSDLSYVVTVGKGGDSAVSGTDYKAVSKFSIIVKSGRRSGSNSFNLEPIGDTDWEGDETITIHASGTDGAQSTTLTLTDEGDRPYSGPQVTLSTNPSKVSEADGATTVTVTATLPSAAAKNVQATVSVGGGTATSGTDYAAVSDVTITVAKDATTGTGTFTLTPTQDTLAEGDETITITGPAGVSTPATLTLTDDDTAPDVTLSASPASVTENGGAKTVTVTATSAAVASARTVLVAVGNRQDTATAGTDYTVVPAFNITIAANATTATGSFVLTPTNDTLVENAESISIDGTPESAGATFTVSGTALTLTDDDTQPAVTLTATPSSVAEAALATSVTVTATAASAVAWARTVTVGKTGSAASGTDYAAVSNFDVTIAANALSGTGTFTLKPTQDTTNEGNETIGVAGSSLNTTVTGATVTLADDDVNPAVTLSVSPAEVGESASATTVTVTVTATAAAAMTTARTVSVKVGNTGTATSGTDYAAVSDFNITIAANATTGTGTFTLTPTQDTTNEGNETIGVAGTNSLSTVTGTTLTLVDDDQPTISLTSTKQAISESWSGTVGITATRSGSTTSAVDVTIIVGADTDSATEGEDYQEVADFTITIPAGQTSASKGFTLTGIRDFVSDNNEDLSINGLATGYKVNSVPNGIGIFEWYATIGLTSDVSSVSEHDGATTVTAHINPTVYGNVYVTVSVGGGSAASGTDYAAVSNFTITIPNKASSATGTFTLTPTQDALLESDETININGSGSHFNFYAGRGTSMTLTDAQPIALSVHPSSVSEGAPPTQVAVSATATGTVSTPRTVTVSVGDTGTATSGTDYAAVSDFDIVIPANKTGATNTFTLTPTKDSAGEGDETIGVSGSSTVAYVYPTTLTLADTSPAVTLTAAPSSISEGAGATSVTVTATAASALATARTVTVAVGDTGTATSGTDYAAVSDFTITIASNATSGTGTFTLTPTDDTALEGDETIGVAGTSSEAATISGTSLTLTDDDLPTITLATVPPDVKIAEGAGLTSVTVRATAAAAMKAETTVTLAVGAGGDSATKTTDYTTSNVRTITIPKGQSMAEASFELMPKQDTLVEGDETVSVSGSSSGGHQVTGTSLKLTDDDRHDIKLSAARRASAKGPAPRR